MSNTVTPIKPHGPIWQAAKLDPDVDRVDLSDWSTSHRASRDQVTDGEPATWRDNSFLRGAAAFAILLTATAALGVLAVGLYLLKSAAGIDLFAGHSFMHALLGRG